jgi:hypothetical protein
MKLGRHALVTAAAGPFSVATRRFLLGRRGASRRSVTRSSKQHRQRAQIPPYLVWRPADQRPAGYLLRPAGRRLNQFRRRANGNAGPDVRLLVFASLANPKGLNPMWTAHDLEQSWVSARTMTVNEISLYLAAEPEEFTSAFLKFWNDRLERQIIALTSTEKSFFIWKIIEDTMRRVRQIESAAIINRTVH